MTQADAGTLFDLEAFDAPPGPDIFGQANVSYIDSRSILTVATGFAARYDFTMNPYSGCGFGCGYCYARFFTHDQDKRDGWGTWIVAKQNSQALIARACQSGKLKTGSSIFMSSATDPYRPVERRLGLTRGILETILEHGVQPRLTVHTRSPLVARDPAGDAVQTVEAVEAGAAEHGVDGGACEAQHPGDAVGAEALAAAPAQMRRSSSGGVRRGWQCGAELRSASPASPASRKRRSHFATVWRETRNWRATSHCGQPAATCSTSSRRVTAVRRALRCAMRDLSLLLSLSHTTAGEAPHPVNNLRGNYN